MFSDSWRILDKNLMDLLIDEAIERAEKQRQKRSGRKQDRACKDRACTDR